MGRLLVFGLLIAVILALTACAVPFSNPNVALARDEMEPTGLTHTLMALLAIRAGNLPDAAHHVQHTLDQTQTETHVRQLVDTIIFLDAGQGHQAEQILTTMVGPPDEQEVKPLDQLHLELALAAANEENLPETRHHLEHFAELATGKDRIHAREALKLVEAEDMHELGHAIETLMGLMPHGE